MNYLTTKIQFINQIFGLSGFRTDSSNLIIITLILHFNHS